MTERTYKQRIAYRIELKWSFEKIVEKLATHELLTLEMLQNAIIAAKKKKVE